MSVQSIRRRIMAGIGHLYPLYSGCGTLANTSAFRMLAGRSAERDWARLRDGSHILVPLDDYLGRALYFMGDLDPKVTWVCRRILRPGDTVIDVGANMGLVTLTCAKLVGPSGRVVAYEPNPAMIELLRQSIDRNGFSNIELNAIALGKESGRLQLNVPDDHAGKASLVRTFREDQHSVEIQVDNAAEAFERLEAGAIRFWKIDAEGFEPQIIEGAQAYLERNPPQVVLFEINDDEGPLNGNASITMLESFGYRFFGLPKALLRMRALPLDVKGSYGDLNDFVAVHEGDEMADIVKRLKVNER